MAVPDFARSRPFTLGVELEFQLLDPRSYDLAPGAPDILSCLDDSHRPFIAPEFLQSIIEVQTGICEDVNVVVTDLRSRIQLVEQVAGEQGYLLYSAGLHPFADPAAQVLSDDDRYRRIMDDLQLVGRRFISQGLHVHVGMTSGEDAVQACDALAAYLPVLLAMSASSPYFCGEDTGFASYRTKLFEVLPLAGIGGFLGSWQGYVQEVEMLISRGIIRDIRDLWWDVRPNPRLGTVEIRICDMLATFTETVAMVALIQALCQAIIQRPPLEQAMSLQLLRANKWQAARYGLAGVFNDPAGMLAVETVGMKGAAEKLLEVVQPHLDAFGAGDWIEPLDRLIRQGSSAERQRRFAARRGDLVSMIQMLREGYWQ